MLYVLISIWIIGYNSYVLISICINHMLLSYPIWLIRIPLLDYSNTHFSWHYNPQRISIEKRQGYGYTVHMTYSDTPIYIYILIIYIYV